MWQRRGVSAIWNPLLAAPALLLSACASGGNLANRGGLDQTIGRASYYDIVVEVPLAFRRRGYDIYQNRETSRTLYIETAWRSRAPFEDEAAMGVEMARTRFIVHARLSGPKIYTLTISAENQVTGLPDAFGHQAPAGWSTISATKMYKEYISEISMEIKLKVDAGLRTYDRMLLGSAPPALDPAPDAPPKPPAARALEKMWRASAAA